MRRSQYGHARRAHAELTDPEQLHGWLAAHELLASDVTVTEGDFRRILQVREALRSLLRVNSDFEDAHIQIELLNMLASNAPLRVSFKHDGPPTLEPDIGGVDGVIARFVGIIYTSMVDGTWGRLKVCRYKRCQRAFYDTSKNRSGIWCSMALCGSRLKARAYRERQSTQISG